MKMKAEPLIDVLIVGSGPAGVSAAFPLLEAGIRVHMVDGGKTPSQPPSSQPFLTARQNDPHQWLWMLGDDFQALARQESMSPKFRMPPNIYAFEDGARENRIQGDGFVAISSLARGGLSQIWAGGVACYTYEELRSMPVDVTAMRTSYGAVARRIGISGPQADDLSDFFGLDEYAQAPVPMDELHRYLLDRYLQRREYCRARGFRLGGSRVAVLTQPLADRPPCDLSGNCLWGCPRRSLYTATEDLQRLIRTYNNFYYFPGHVVERLRVDRDGVVVYGKNRDGYFRWHARRVLLAAGTLASTRLALQAIDFRDPLSLQSCPIAAFLLWIPRFLGRPHKPTFGLSQLSFSLELSDGTPLFGSLFSTTGIPVTEFVRHLPLSKRFGLDFLEPLLRSAVVGNLFFPGNLTEATVRLDADDHLLVRGQYSEKAYRLIDEARRTLTTIFRKLGAVLLPGGFKVGAPGADVHYVGTLPMHAHPAPGRTSPFGELWSTHGIFLVDGSSISVLPAKPHTLTIMANADRIARYIAAISRASLSHAQ